MLQVNFRLSLCKIQKKYTIICSIICFIAQ